MNFHQSKNIFKEWNKKIDNLLTEITDEELVSIQDAIDKATNNPSVLPFNNQFGNKLRILVPIAYNVYQDEGALGELLNTLVVAGWKVDLNTGIASKSSETEFEGVKRVQTRQMKVNAIWTTFLDLLRKHEIIFDKAYQQSPDLADIAEYTATNPELNKISSQMEALMGEAIPGQYVADMAFKKAEQKINNFIKTWQTEAAKIKGKMAEESTYSVLFSRHPVDVLRMSDFKDITSCHAPKSRPTGLYADGGSYYNCAVAEARDGGAIAYLVRTEDAKAIDLTQKFVLSDESRGQQAIDPIARIRLRVLDNPDLEISFAIPEDRIYGTNIKGFQETIEQWVISQQATEFKKVFDFYSSPENNKNINLSDFYRLGGSYEDTSVGQLFSSLKNKVEGLKDFKLINNVYFDNITQTEVDTENIGPLKQEVKKEIDEFNANMKKWKVSLACDEDYTAEMQDDYVHIDPKVYYYYDIPFNEVISEKSLQFLVSQKGLKFLQEEISELIEDKYVSAKAEYEKYPDFMRIKLYPMEKRFIDTSIRSVNDLIDYLGNMFYQFKSRDNKIATINYIINVYIKREGVIDGGALARLNTDIINQDFESDWTLEGDEDAMDNPSIVSGEIGLVIPFNEIKNLEAVKTNLTNKKFVQYLKNNIYEFPDYNDLNVFFDVDEDLMIYIKIDFEENAKDEYVTAAANMFQNETKESLTDKMIEAINTMFKSSTSIPKQKLQEFKHLNSRWKMFLG